MAARAVVSSVLATLTDGVVYQAVVGGGHYVAAAFLGAIAGAVTNFSLNRWWAFPPTARPVGRQAILYVIGSGFVYLALQALLWLFIERLGVDARVAWIPAKVMAFVLVSYPFQRLVVFARAR